MTHASLRNVSLASAALVAVLGATFGASASVAQEVEGNVALVTDYRFRGVSLSDEAIAIQGGLDVGFESGFYVGTWASSIEPVGNSEIELDLYAGFGGEAGALAYDVGLLVYTYPGASDVEYAEFYGSLGTTLGPIAATAGLAYAPEQDNIGGDDNLYLYTTGELPLGESGFSLTGTLGYETGAFGDIDGDGDDKIHWELGLTTAFQGIDVGLTYIDSSEDSAGSDGTVVLSISKAL